MRAVRRTRDACSRRRAYSRPRDGRSVPAAARSCRAAPIGDHLGSSGVMLQALASGRPVLVPDAGPHGIASTRLALGRRPIDPGDPDDSASAVPRAAGRGTRAISPAESTSSWTSRASRPRTPWPRAWAMDTRRRRDTRERTRPAPGTGDAAVNRDPLRRPPFLLMLYFFYAVHAAADLPARASRSSCSWDLRLLREFKHLLGARPALASDPLMLWLVDRLGRLLRSARSPPSSSPRRRPRSSDRRSVRPRRSARWALIVLAVLRSGHDCHSVRRAAALADPRRKGFVYLFIGYFLLRGMLCRAGRRIRSIRQARWSSSIRSQPRCSSFTRASTCGLFATEYQTTPSWATHHADLLLHAATAVARHRLRVRETHMEHLLVVRRRWSPSRPCGSLTRARCS